LENAVYQEMSWTELNNWVQRNS